MLHRALATAAILTFTILATAQLPAAQMRRFPCRPN